MGPVLGSSSFDRAFRLQISILIIIGMAPVSPVWLRSIGRRMEDNEVGECAYGFAGSFHIEYSDRTRSKFTSALRIKNG